MWHSLTIISVWCPYATLPCWGNKAVYTISLDAQQLISHGSTMHVMGNTVPTAEIEPTSLAFQGSGLPLHHIGSLMSPPYPYPPTCQCISLPQRSVQTTTHTSRTLTFKIKVYFKLINASQLACAKHSDSLCRDITVILFLPLAIIWLAWENNITNLCNDFAGLCQ